MIYFEYYSVMCDEDNIEREMYTIRVDQKYIYFFRATDHIIMRLYSKNKNILFGVYFQRR